MELTNLDQNKPEIDPSLNFPKVKKIIPLNLIIGIIIGIILTTSIVSAVHFYKESQIVLYNNNVDTSPPKELVETPSVQNEYSQFGSLTWLNEPKKIPSINIFDPNKSDNENYLGYDIPNAEYFQVGNFSNGAQLINVYVDPREPGGTILIRIIKDSDNLYLLTNMVANREVDNVKQYIFSNIYFSDIKIKDLEAPESISLGTDNIINFADSDYGSSKKMSDFKNLQKITDSNYGQMYKNTFSIFSDIPLNQLAGKVIYLKMKDGTFVTYGYKNELSDDQVPQIDWISGSNTDSYTKNLVSGCGIQNFGSVPVILKDSNLITDKVKVGTTKKGFPVYQLKNSNNLFVQNLYSEYKNTRSYDKSAAILSLDEFAAINNHFLWQDPSGDWQIFVNSKYGPMVECGKPVIYLYPEKETQIKVQVDAKITKSEPTYPIKGWNVIAKPNGELTYQNQNYPYLFWEGLGNGIYPNYKNKGTVVAQKDLISTIYKQLSQLGLNQKESTDFMEFWQSKLPTTPYVRLTWLDTQDMNNLAPLYVSPKPDTQIRIFLEFEGLEKQISLIPQKLSAPKRTGFTLIEWGGLLLK